MGQKPTKKSSRVLTRSTIADQVYEDTKERILDQTLKPGERLTIEVLSRSLGVSSSPIREALTRLESEKLVVSEFYTGYSVAPAPDPKYLRDLLDFRIMLEGECARIGAPRKNAETLVAMTTAFEKMATTKRLGTRYREYDDFIAEDQKFHRAIVASSDNLAMIAIYADLNAILHQSRLYISRSTDGAPAEEVLAEHHEILAAFVAGDGEAAATAIRKHFDGGKRRLHKVTSQTPESGTA